VSWEDKPEVQKGNIGERLVDEYLLRKGIVPYRPIVSQAHPFDRLCASSDKKRIYVVEVKTKPRREHYPDTGVEFRHFNDYLNIAIQHSMDVFIYFVDEVRKEIYGGELVSNLAQIRQEWHEGRELVYPLKHKGIIYFPLSAMEHVADLPEEVCKKLASLRRSNYEVKQKALF
jgi:hypothetical protein